MFFTIKAPRYSILYTDRLFNIYANTTIWRWDWYSSDQADKTNNVTILDLEYGKYPLHKGRAPMKHEAWTPLSLRGEPNCLNIQSPRNREAMKNWDFTGEKEKKFNIIVFLPVVLQCFICAPNHPPEEQRSRCSEKQKKNNTNIIAHRPTTWQLYLPAQSNMQHL